MPKISVYNQEGTSVGDMALSDAIFNVKPVPGLIHEVMLAQRANARHAIANTKTRGEVSGGGKKPWKQKGTGRARQGSTRSPQWVGGGITFGPTSDRNFSLKVNKKAKKKALFMALTDKVLNQKMLIVDQFKTAAPKTKAMAVIMSKLPIDRNVLIVAPAAQPELMRMVRNLQNVTMVTPQSVNLVDVLNHRTVLFLKEAVPTFEQIYRV